MGRWPGAAAFTALWKQVGGPHQGDGCRRSRACVRGPRALSVPCDPAASTPRVDTRSDRASGSERSQPSFVGAYLTGPHKRRLRGNRARAAGTRGPPRPCSRRARAGGAGRGGSPPPGERVHTANAGSGAPLPTPPARPSPLHPRPGGREQTCVARTWRRDAPRRARPSNKATDQKKCTLLVSGSLCYAGRDRASEVCLS